MPEAKKDKGNIAGKAVPSHVETELVLTRYAQTKNFSRTAKEFATNPMRVKRMWERLSDEDRRAYTDAAEETKQELRQTINKSDLQFTKDYAIKMKEALARATNELHDRLSPKRVKNMSDKELINALRLLNNICIGGDDEETPDSPNSLFALMDMSMNEKMTIKITQDENGKE